MAEPLDKHISQLEVLEERLFELEWEQLRQRTQIALNGWLTYSREAIIAISHKGWILALNDNTRRLLGYTKNDEMTKKPISILIPEQYRELIEQYRQNYIKHPISRLLGSATNSELLALCKDGTMIKVRVILTPLVIDTALVVCVIICGT